MAEGPLFNTIEKLIGKLSSMVIESWNMRDDLEKLVENMFEIKAVILDAEEQQATNNHQVQLWLEKLKDALDDMCALAHTEPNVAPPLLDDADDLLDDFYTEDLKREVMTDDKKAKKVRIFFSFKMVQKIKELSKRIKGLNVDRRIFNFTNRTPKQHVLKQRGTHSFIRDEEVIGREEEKKELIELLFNTNINVKNNVSVISIIGIGGLGKTALAQFVYNDREVQQHFEMKKWVCVSNDFDVKDIAAKITECKTNVEMDKVQLELRKKVEGKRYLLVLDDIWNDDRDHWLQLMTLLKDGAKGSKIIITTRSENVAKISGTSSLFFLNGLDEKQSWRLFSQLAFENEEGLENQNLVSMGKEIVKKCSGVPLAIRSIGSLLYSMQTEEDWSTFKNKDLMKIDEQSGNKIFQLIKLSYDHLPFQLKKCFAFCSLFPKDYLIEKETLIRLWIAQGFIQSSDEDISLEDVGDKYFKDFVHKCFFQNINKHFLFDDIVHFQMHDIVHDLASFVSKNDYVLVNEKVHNIDKQTLHVSFGFILDDFSKVPSSLLNAYKLRTFLLPQHRDEMIDYKQASKEVSVCNFILTSSRRFRVLDLNQITPSKIPSCIGRMRHLRYLDLSRNSCVKLPRSLTELINLETLILNDCQKLRELPKDLWKLVSLRHLELDNCDGITFMPCGIGKMTNLQTLTHFVLNTTSKNSARASELRGLNNLRGPLEIRGLECLRHCPTEANHINLIEKSHIRLLTLAWEQKMFDDGNDFHKDDIILQGLVLHSNIKALEIKGFCGVTFPKSINLFTNLTELNLTNCTRLQYIEFSASHVKHLWMSNLPCLEWIVNDSSSESSSAFSASLIDIDIICGLNNLKGWCRCSEEEISRGCHHQFNSLDNLSILQCCDLVSIPQHKDINKIILMSSNNKLLQQAVNHSKVELLVIQDIANLKSLSGVLQHLTTVSELHINHCPELDPCNDEDGFKRQKFQNSYLIHPLSKKSKF